MKHFEIWEFVNSQKASELKIKNKPTQEAEDNINELVDNLLDPLREAWAVYCANEHIGTPVLHVFSGYRSPRLNTAIGGSKTSVHTLGYAADIVPENGRFIEFKRFARTWLGGRKFDQMISENEDKDGKPEWIHFGWKRGDGSQRKQLLSKPKTGNKYIPMTY